jgi:hypothetical protein
MRVLIDGNEYVPAGIIPPLNDDRLKTALLYLTEIQQFPECQHKHRAWGWDALNALARDLAKLPADVAYDRMRPETADERVGVAPQKKESNQLIRLNVDITGETHQECWSKLLSIVCAVTSSKNQDGRDYPTYISTPDGTIETEKEAK